MAAPAAGELQLQTPLLYLTQITDLSVLVCALVGVVLGSPAVTATSVLIFNATACTHPYPYHSIVALVEGRRILVANVGDSSALLALRGRTLLQSDLVQHSLWPDGGGIMHPCCEAGTVGDPASAHSPACDQVLILTADHSPESLREYGRMILTHPNPQNPQEPHLMVVYDAPSLNKVKCAPVFGVDPTGKPYVTGRGRYYKNVRKEWASLVATPPRARFQGQ